MTRQYTTSMAVFRWRAMYLLFSVAGVDAASAFVRSPRPAAHPPTSINGPNRSVAPSRRRAASVPAAKCGRRRPPFARTSCLRAREVEEGTPIATEGDNPALGLALESNDLDAIISCLQSDASSIESLSGDRLRSIFDSVEVATAESDENTVNKRAIEDANIASASGAGGVEFRSTDRVRAQMTKLYRLLREEGRLGVFGAVGRLAPASSSSMLALTEEGGGTNYPTSGSKIIPPTLLEKITGIEMINLTPQPTNLLLYGGAVLALLEGATSLYYGINFNLLVVTTLLLALMDQILVSGAVFETALRMVRPETTVRITKHEAGHFLCAYLLGCPVEGVVLSTWAALNDGRFGGRSSRAVSAGTSYYDLDLSEQIAGLRPLTRESIDRYSIIVMGGISAEAVEFGRADGGAGDEEALVRFLRSLNPRSGNAVSAWTPELIRNQARWGATQAVLLLREYKPCYDALVDALERGGDLGQCIVAIEEAARREGLGWLRGSLGTVLEEGEYGKWVPKGDVEMDHANVSLGMESSGANGGAMAMNSSSSTEAEGSNGVPTYGEDPITSTEEFLRKYRGVMERKLASIDEKLQELDGDAKGD